MIDWINYKPIPWYKDELFVGPLIINLAAIIGWSWFLYVILTHTCPLHL